LNLKWARHRNVNLIRLGNVNREGDGNWNVAVLRNLLNTLNWNILSIVNWPVNIDVDVPVGGERLGEVDRDLLLTVLDLGERDVHLSWNSLRDWDADLTRNGNLNLARNCNWDLSGHSDITGNDWLNLGSESLLKPTNATVRDVGETKSTTKAAHTANK
jgi:hypothetical protein